VHRVTFDSNVWRQVASPLKFPNNPCPQTFQKLNAACSQGVLAGFLSETTLALEQIKRDDRLAWLKSHADVSVTESISDDGTIELNICMGPSNTVVPVVSKTVQDHLEDAYEIGIRVLRSKRIGGPISALLKDVKYFHNYPSDKEYHRYNNRSGEIGRKLESMGVGIANIKAKGAVANPAKRNNGWVDGIASLGESEKKAVAELVAEWADADAVATSVAHDVAYFCTNDVAKGSTNKGITSAMSPVKSKEITNAFGIEFVSPSELVQKLGL